MNIAVYAGTFDPPTSGHLSVIRQAARLFSHLRVLLAVNPEKKTLFSETERLEMLREAVAKIPNVSVDAHAGFVVEYAHDIGATCLVRGIRGASDANFETELAQTNRSLAPDLFTILLPAEAHLSVVSSSGLKERASRGEDISEFCPPGVLERMRARLDGSAPLGPVTGAVGGDR